MVLSLEKFEQNSGVKFYGESDRDGREGQQFILHFKVYAFSGCSKLCLLRLIVI
jgi:hypothetical protein